MHNLFASSAARSGAADQLLHLFAKLLTLEGGSHPQRRAKGSKRPFYRRAWGPLLSDGR